MKKPGRHKVSTVFLDYAEPMLDLFLAEKENPTYDELNKMMKIPWLIWNACYVEKKDSKSNYIEEARLLIQSISDEFNALFDFMVERRRNEFSEYDYMIGEHIFYCDEKTGEERFRAEARRHYDSNLH